MNALSSRTLTFFDKQVIALIIEKYGMDDFTAIEKYFMSETYNMLIDKDLEIYAMSPRIVFDMWEAEQIVGDPRLSQYIRR